MVLGGEILIAEKHLMVIIQRIEFNWILTCNLGVFDGAGRMSAVRNRLRLPFWEGYQVRYLSD